MQYKSFIAALLIAALATAATAQAQSIAKLLEEAMVLEDPVGDLDGAIKIYGRIVARSRVERPLAAQAYFRLGECYLKQGEKPIALKLPWGSLHDGQIWAGNVDSGANRVIGPVVTVPIQGRWEP